MRLTDRSRLYGMSSNKEIRRIVKACEKAGFTVRYTGSGHIQLIPPDKDADIIVISHSPGGSGKAFNQWRTKLARHGVKI